MLKEEEEELKFKKGCTPKCTDIEVIQCGDAKALWQDQGIHSKMGFCLHTGRR